MWINFCEELKRENLASCENRLNMAASAVLFVSLLLLVFWTVPNAAYSSFKDSIPNGHKVPHPCNKDKTWDGVGHVIAEGAGPVNSFGEDFKNFGWWWSPDVCNADSDEDGMSNGMELGDPYCMWYAGGLPDRTYNITHPGICEPIDSEHCQKINDFLDCSEEYECPQTKDPDVKRQELKLTSFEVPQQTSSYYCADFEVSSVEEYHIIATEALVDNGDVAYNIALYGCTDAVSERSYSHACDWMDSYCSTFIGMWSVGVSDMCFGDVGFRVGPNTFQRVMVKVSYKNPNYISDLFDTSGMAVYLKPATSDQEKDLKTLTFGTQLMEIPPGEYAYEVESICKGTCTNFYMVTAPVKIWGALNLMNRLGSSMHVELFRDGMKVGDVTWDDDYDVYKRSVHMPELELQPGDEVKVTCVYNTVEVKGYTRFGESMMDEMCQAYVFAYPASSVTYLDQCFTFGELDFCDYSFQVPINTAMGECNWPDFTTVNESYVPKWMTEVSKSCSEDGYCRPQCKDTVKSFMEVEPCLTKEAQLLVNYQLEYSGTGHRGMAALNTCRGTIYAEMEDGGDDDHGDDKKTACSWEECYYNYCDFVMATDSTSYYNAAPSMLASAMVVMALSLGITVFF